MPLRVACSRDASGVVSTAGAEAVESGSAAASGFGARINGLAGTDADTGEGGSGCHADAVDEEAEAACSTGPAAAGAPAA